MSATTAGVDVTIRGLKSSDLSDLVRIDAQHTGRRKPAWWSAAVRRNLSVRRGRVRVGIVADRDGVVVGYLLGEGRAFEFGSEPCGWIFAVGVDRACEREGIASRLLEEACRRFAAAKLGRVRTMVRRDDVPVLSFFRANRFVGGSFVQLERELTSRRSS
ncbi:MAG TPA: GNAT family N-acetyltransferase [Candidatus Polarisedimenticolia bacterium]|nr:GNAT family N-acetyltransferase [Candidatus Polarisedimenticolia bacterium]